ncbi:MAG: hypothetical protein F6K62_08120 [Sphaerospermopsis sp. SIO1G2]|nr:hypothetical protein [Sphaerospermopsis sp. SIO1G1]NET70910.1 hypothetical protein [Sphaerospermopsis sp. SIO1G2]
MANFGFLIGCIYVVFSILFPILGIISLFASRDETDDLMFLLRLLELIIVPLIMLICGFVLVFQGWRLDPIIQFQQLLLFVIIVYLLFKETLLSLLFNKFKNK